MLVETNSFLLLLVRHLLLEAMHLFLVASCSKGRVEIRRFLNASKTESAETGSESGDGVPNLLSPHALTNLLGARALLPFSQTSIFPVSLSKLGTGPFSAKACGF